MTGNEMLIKAEKCLKCERRINVFQSIGSFAPFPFYNQLFSNLLEVKMCILSLKGGCYFACGIHIADALFLLWTFVFDIIHVNKLWWHAPVEDDPNLTWYFVLIGFYIVLAILIGFMIFRGIESESLRIIGGGAASFLILQIVAFITTLCWWYPIPPLEDPFGLLESARIGRFVIRTLATIAYIAVLGLYVRHLKIRLQLEDRNAVFGYRKPRSVV